MNFNELTTYFNDRSAIFFECGKENSASDEMEITAGSKHPNTARQAAAHIIDSIKSGHISKNQIDKHTFTLRDGKCAIHLPSDFDSAVQNDQENNLVTQIVENMEITRG